LLSVSRGSKGDFNLTLVKYALERYLYRISVSPHRDRFLLKGALLFSLWYDTPRRPTRDADFLGLDPYAPDEMVALFQEICGIACDDGMKFLPETVRAVEIREDKRYGGIRVTLIGKLGTARCTVQVDVGYGDAVTPDAKLASFPTILEDHPSPLLLVYPKETVIAEKIEAIVSLGMANSRMKDYYDLYVLLNEGSLNRDAVPVAIGRTFARRKTSLPQAIPIGLSEEFIHNPTKAAQWNAFLSRNKLEAPTLKEVGTSIREAIKPILKRLGDSD
jgi:predicted nucleotidyltransferase component of viral defense system